MSIDDDRDAFREAMRGVKPLKTSGRVALTPPRAARRRAPRRDSFAEILDGTALAAAEPVGEEIVFQRASVPRRVLQRLRSGAFSIEAEIDLHGLTAAEARRVLREFIVDSADRRIGCVRVIHGKGLRSGAQGPVLKGLVQAWLPQWDEVLAFAVAQSRDGGSGALYVLLKRRS